MKLIEHPRVTGLVNQFVQLSRREQVIMNITLQFVLLALVFLLALEPLWQAIAINRSRLQSLNDNTLIMENQTLAMQKNPVNDPNPSLRSQQDQLQQQLGQVQARNQQQMAALVTPQQLSKVLEQVLAETPALQLLRLENLPPQPLLTIPAGQTAAVNPVSTSRTASTATVSTNSVIGGISAASATGAGGNAAEAESETARTILWRHGLRLHLRATWPAVLDYLQRMEQLPGTLHWQQLEYHQQEYPWGELTFEVFTISVSREVVGA